ncbi:MAG TPA: NADH-quinone oxidoreductase subunit L [Rhodospirillaceae bacterium]|mgnify:CR=1 FL=1|jgi:NADH-quinone oxidoreductase subunit L|nr:NADH-quinone oxidoreductase subunit L [Alphaproteobacteria bacterium]HBH26386.1 NADH-quinone oxidoreductase subunit L [Rhodospirillaceae bacterium]
MEVLAVFLPLAAFLAVGAGSQRGLPDAGAAFLACVAVLASAAISTWLFLDIAIGGNDGRIVSLAPFIEVGVLRVDWTLRVDALSVTMMAVVTAVSAAVHIYAIGYMRGDPGFARFMAYLSLFTFAMLALVTADNLVQLFFGWEGVGLASYLLIGFYNAKPSANAAAIKAFVMNRVGDLGLVLAMCWAFAAFGTLSFDGIFAAAQSVPGWALNGMALLLLIGAAGKSAQLGLHTWLPDAMEGPTPVSALIHAATMVTAGVFLLARMSPLLAHAPEALMIVTALGAATAFVAATIALVQTDIKRVIAYSTMSQLGYMVLAIGVGAYGAAVFHLVTHAFFKALLFLGAGAVIHAMGGKQDMRRMGALRGKLPWTYALMWVGVLALAGVPPLAGYFSKDAILEAAFAGAWPAFAVGIAAAVMTAFYGARVMILTFHGSARWAEGAHPHEAPPVMLGPLWFLAAGAVVAGILFYDVLVGTGPNECDTLKGHVGNFISTGCLWRAERFWDGTLAQAMPEGAHHVAFWVKALPTAAALLGLGLAVWLYQTAGARAARVAVAAPWLYRLFLHKWYFDEAWRAAFLRPALRLGAAFAGPGDRGTIDRFGPDGAAAASHRGALSLSAAQSGVLSHYALTMVVALAALLAWTLLGG